MDAIQTIDGPGTRSTVTQAPSFAGGGQSSELIDFYKQLLARKSQTMSAPAAHDGGGVPNEAELSRAPRTAPSMGGFGGRPAKSQLDMARERDEILRMQARQSPPPMRMTTFASGANNFYTPDTNAMNAYQREAYLPGNSGQIYGPEHEAKAKKGFADEMNWSAQQDALRQMPSY